MDPTKKAFLTLPEVAAVLNVKVGTVRTLIRQGHLNVDPLVKRNSRVPISSVEAYILRAQNYIHNSATRHLHPV